MICAPTATSVAMARAPRPGYEEMTAPLMAQPATSVGDRAISLECVVARAQWQYYRRCHL